MKKTLAIVLALVMVLAMIPAMSADVTENKTITDKQYFMNVLSWGNEVDSVYKEKVNSITFEYDYEDLVADVTGKWTEDAKMGLVQVGGFDADFTEKAKVTIDGKEIALDDYAGYKAISKYLTEWNVVTFPVELTKAGYTDTYLVQVTETKDGKTVTETAKVSVTFKNTATYKDAAEAYITNIVSKTDEVFAYIVGDKIYFDSINDKKAVQAEITFADNNGKAFTGITYAYNPYFKVGDNAYVQAPAKASLAAYLNGKDEAKLDKSATKFDFATVADGETIYFELETKASYFETKDYTIKFRDQIKPEDPKGIYFAEASKTIAVGEKYTPVLKGVKSGKALSGAKITAVSDVNDIVDILDGTTVIGTNEGVVYITASYTVPGSDTTYTASSIKVVVTLPGTSIPTLESDVYYVTCRALNVRAGAGTSYKKVDLIHRGDAVKVVELKNGWAKLDNGTYVCAKYIAK